MQGNKYDSYYELTKDTPYLALIFEILVNTLRPRQDGRLFPYDIFKCFLLIENI